VKAAKNTRVGFFLSYRIYTVETNKRMSLFGRDKWLRRSVTYAGIAGCAVVLAKKPATQFLGKNSWESTESSARSQL
jgi:hypothetical protein